MWELPYLISCSPLGPSWLVLLYACLGSMGKGYLTLNARLFAFDMRPCSRPLMSLTLLYAPLHFLHLALHLPYQSIGSYCLPDSPSVVVLMFLMVTTRLSFIFSGNVLVVGSRFYVYCIMGLNVQIFIFIIIRPECPFGQTMRLPA